MNAKSDGGELAKEILIEYMKDFQKRNSYLQSLLICIWMRKRYTFM